MAVVAENRSLRFASSERDSWTLAPVSNGEDYQDLERGMLVKMIFGFERAGIKCPESMWVVVAEKVRDSYIGILANQPFGSDRVRLGMEIPFGPGHVLDACPADEVSRHWLKQAPSDVWLPDDESLQGLPRDLLDDLRCHAWNSSRLFDDPEDDLVDHLKDRLMEDACLDKAAAHVTAIKIVEMVKNRHDEIQATWKDTTDCDRLWKAAEMLDDQDIVFFHAPVFAIEEAEGFVHTFMEDLSRDNIEVRGCVLYSEEDALHLADDYSKDSLNLTFGSSSRRPEDDRLLAEAICNVMQEVGLKPVWIPGHNRIELKDFGWGRRRLSATDQG